MVTPFIVFDGSCGEAMSFYQDVFKSEIKSSYLYGDYIPDGIETPPDNMSGWVMHGEMEICGTNVWFADEAMPCSKGDNIRLTATVQSGKDAALIFDALCADGTVTLPPTETYYSVFHAAVTDKFGVNWNIIAEEQAQKG